jgi:hypothetical protein
MTVGEETTGEATGDSVGVSATVTPVKAGCCSPERP